MTPLLFAAQKGFVDVAKVSWRTGPTRTSQGARRDERADVHEPDERQEADAPQLGVLLGHVDVVRLLLRHNADVTVEDQWGNDALALARQEGHREVVQVLVEAQRRQE